LLSQEATDIIISKQKIEENAFIAETLRQKWETADRSNLLNLRDQYWLNNRLFSLYSFCICPTSILPSSLAVFLAGQMQRHIPGIFRKRQSHNSGTFRYIYAIIHCFEQLLAANLAAPLKTGDYA